MVMLHFLEFDPILLLEKCQILFTILSKLCSPELASHISCHIRGNGRSAISFKRSVSRECTYVSDGGITSVVEESEAVMSFVQQSGSFIPFLRSMIEVFIYELLVHRKLRQYFMMVDTISCTNEKLFMCHLSHGDSDAVLELISAHFLLSVSDEQAFNKSLETLFPWHAEEPPFIEQSLTAAMQFFGTHVMFSAPQILQAYMISLVARCISINMAPDNQSLDSRLMNYYLSSFERSFILYCGHISLLFGDHPEKPESAPACNDNPCISGTGLHPSFESYIRPVTYNQINVQATKFADSSHHLSSKKKSDLTSAYIAYMKENQNILDKSYRDEILSILSRIISRTLSGELGDTILLKKEMMDTRIQSEISGVVLLIKDVEECVVSIAEEKELVMARVLSNVCMIERSTASGNGRKWHFSGRKGEEDSKLCSNRKLVKSGVAKW
ncbi:hypothetical protein BVC80_521g29 [Macleaya cordata]|uniref:DUF7812 domain-containing protein n=1 Tax=Macleaya cordata TaxID=56857 RepID=A0A200R930_MACCD|nr:hypothetical protein BVC80_521g29 [Macleaya cordata]